jgi:hypothetical protein
MNAESKNRGCTISRRKVLFVAIVMLTVIGAVVGSLIATGVLELSTRTATPSANQMAELNNVFEAMFRYQFKHEMSGMGKNAPAYFLSFNSTKQPSFLKRFEGHTPPVKDGIAFREGEGIKFSIHSWEWISEDRIKVTASWHAGMQNSGGGQYILERKGGKWVVVDYGSQWIA